jgi:hypothetical protein
MIDVNVLLRSISPGGGIDQAASVTANAIKNSSKEKRREFVYEYRRIKKTYEGYIKQQEKGEPIDNKAYEDCMKRFLIYKMAFRKLGIDIDSIS